MTAHFEFRFLRIDEIDLSTHAAWLVQGILPANGLGVIFGPPSAGKSFFAVDLARHIASGDDWGGRPPFAFAGIWRYWKGNYKDELREMEVYSMLTTKPNELVKPIHPTRMPVILHPDDHEQWLSGTADDATELLNPYDPNLMRIALEGGKSDEGKSS